MAGTIFMIIIILLIVYIVTSCVRIVPQAQAYVIERLGAYNGCLLYTSPSPRDTR